MTGPTRWRKGDDGLGYSGHKHQQGEKVIAIIDHRGYVLAPVPVAPVYETAMVLLPQGLHALKKVAKGVGQDLKGVCLNLDGGFASVYNRKCIFNAGLIPNIPENPRNRKHPKRGRKGGQRRHPRITHACRADLCIGGQMQTAAAPI